jgi:hypothetical protein
MKLSTRKQLLKEAEEELKSMKTSVNEARVSSALVKVLSDVDDAIALNMKEAKKAAIKKTIADYKLKVEAAALKFLQENAPANIAKTIKKVEVVDFGFDAKSKNRYTFSGLNNISPEVTVTYSGNKKAETIKLEKLVISYDRDFASAHGFSVGSSMR